MTQPAEQTDFRYFLHKGYSLPQFRGLGDEWQYFDCGGWWPVPSHWTPERLDDEGWIETDATGEPLAKGEKPFDWNGKTPEEQTALDQMNAPAPAAPGGEPIPSDHYWFCRATHSFYDHEDNLPSDTGFYRKWIDRKDEFPDADEFFRKRHAANEERDNEPSPPAGGGDAAITDEFRGDNERLRSSIKALIELSDRDALVPHGIGGHARALLAASYHRLVTPPTPTPAATPGEATPKTDRLMKLIVDMGEIIWEAGFLKEGCQIGPVPYAMELIRKRIAELERGSAGLRVAVQEAYAELVNGPRPAYARRALEKVYNPNKSALAGGEEAGQ